MPQGLQLVVLWYGLSQKHLLRFAQAIRTKHGNSLLLRRWQHCHRGSHDGLAGAMQSTGHRVDGSHKEQMGYPYTNPMGHA